MQAPDLLFFVSFRSIPCQIFLLGSWASKKQIGIEIDENKRIQDRKNPISLKRVIDMWKNASWLGIPHAEIAEKKIYHGDMTGRFAYFRCEIQLPAHCTLSLDITANSRYRLWINEKPVLSGPCKGDRFRQYYETVDVTSWLREGKNLFCVGVLYCDPDAVEHQLGERAAIYGAVGRQCGHRLAVEGTVLDAEGKEAGVVTTGIADWRVWLDNSFYLKSDEITQFLGAVIEEIDCAQSPVHWKELLYDASGWRSAGTLSPAASQDPFAAVGVLPMFRMREREIPLLYEHEKKFVRAFFQSGKELIWPENGFTVGAGETKDLFLDAGAIVNGYPQYRFLGGKGAKVRVTYFEKFGGPGSDRKRDDVRGEVVGLTDELMLDGTSLCYEPFWVRCFRFVRITVEANREAVTVCEPQYRQTGYPLQVQSAVRSSAPWVASLWEICVRTLGNCMMETYMDCPYYEQLQYGMDTRLEALFTYAVTADTALVRKALVDFHYGMQPEGLTTGKWPSAYLQVLSTFSLHYIYMLREYLQQKEDPALLRLCRRDVDAILDTCDACIGKDGLVGKLDFWNFVDWSEAWTETGGEPAALREGPSTIINLMVARALADGAWVMEQSGRPALAAEYRQRRETILSAVQTLCWDEEAGLYREGPSFRQYSRHAQSWAVLNGMKEGADAAKLLQTAIEKEDCLKCSFSTSYEWFRALERAGMFDVIRAELDAWIELLALDCTTCPETPKNARSDCHAWSALPLYEMVHTLAGIQTQPTGELLVRPHLMDLPDLSGRAATKKGTVTFDYRKEETGEWRYTLELPAGMTGRFVCPDGREVFLQEGNNLIKKGADAL